MISESVRRAIVADLCKHPKAEEYRAKAFGNTSLLSMAEVLKGQDIVLGKEDFLSVGEDGVCFADTPGFWENFSSINAGLTGAGERFTLADFTRDLGEKRTLLGSMLAHNAIRRAFQPENWYGDYEGMRQVWHKIELSLRRANTSSGSGSLPLEVVRAVLAKEGREPTEDRLGRLGLQPIDIHSAFSSFEAFTEMSKRLEAAGDRWRKEYLLMTDEKGRSPLYQSEAWGVYFHAAEALAKHGEFLDVKDFTYLIDINSVAILTSACEAKKLDVVFASSLWVGRLEEMRALWACVDPSRKVSPFAQKDFDAVYAETEDKTFGARVDWDALTQKADMIRPVGEQDGVAADFATAAGNTPQVRPLGLKTFWDRYAAQKVKEFSAQGDAISLEDLRMTSGLGGESCLVKAVKFGHVSTVLEAVRLSGGRLQKEDLFLKDSNGQRVIDILAERKELALVFVPDLWVGRLEEMQAVWKEVSPLGKPQINIAQASRAVRQATIARARKKSRSGPGL